MKDKSILLVEDNPQDEMLILRALRRINLANEIDIARDGQQALDYLFAEGEFAGRAGLELPAVVLLDIGLPKLDGNTLCELIKTGEATKHIKIIMLTGHRQMNEMEDSFKAGADVYVNKPYEWPRLLEHIQKLLG